MPSQCLLVLFTAVGLARGFHVHVPASSPKVAALPMSATARPGAATTAPVSKSGGAGAEGKSEIFDWNKQWYPVLSLKDTDPGRVHAVQLLGKDLVVWRDGQERWTCFDDRCPHRAVPLSEGRVENDGTLLCAYHAWRFDADGKCLAIPQSTHEPQHAAQAAACAKVYPTQVAQDLIWVWGDNGQDAGLESALAQPALIPDLGDEEGIKSGRVKVAPVGDRDLPYGWEMFMENVLDPSHVPISHHGIVGNRYTDPKPLHLERRVEGPDTAKGGFKYTFKGEDGATSMLTFTPPALVTNEIVEKDGSKATLVLYGTPTSPGWCRMLGRQVSSLPAESGDGGKKKKEKKMSANVASSRAAAKVPSWLQHAAGSLFLHQDLVFLHQQERTLASAGYDSSTYSKAVFTPAASDRAVHALRKWMTAFGSGGPAWDKGCDPSLPPREHNRKVLFDVYEQHTKHCASCLGALKRINTGLKTAKTSVVVSLAWTVLRGARAAAAAAASPSSSVLTAATGRAMLPGVALTLATLGALKGLEKLHGMFYSHDFHHQDNP